MHNGLIRLINQTRSLYQLSRFDILELSYKASIATSKSKDVIGLINMHKLRMPYFDDSA